MSSPPTSAAPPNYLLESHLEAERLESMTNVEAAREYLTRVGLREGMCALDAGAGVGSIARVMSHLVGARGCVYALDASRDRLRFAARRAEQLGCDNVRFIVGDLYDAPFRPGAFDFVWSRLVFQYLSDPDRALARLVEMARPGGKIVVGDMDGAGGFHDPCPPRIQEGLQRLEHALQGRLDLYAGRKLFHRFRLAGLEQIRVHLLPHHLYAGEAPEVVIRNWEVKFQTLRPVGTLAFGGAEAYEEFARAFLDHLKDPNSFTYSVFFLVEGVKAGAAV